MARADHEPKAKPPTCWGDPKLLDKSWDVRRQALMRALTVFRRDQATLCRKNPSARLACELMLRPLTTEALQRYFDATSAREAEKALAVWAESHAMLLDLHEAQVCRRCQRVTIGSKCACEARN